jgi:hypothetical protein
VFFNASLSPSLKSFFEVVSSVKMGISRQCIDRNQSILIYLLVKENLPIEFIGLFK